MDCEQKQEWIEFSNQKILSVHEALPICRSIKLKHCSPSKTPMVLLNASRISKGLTCCYSFQCSNETLFQLINCRLGWMDQWQTFSHLMAFTSVRDQQPHHRSIPLAFISLRHPGDNICDRHRPLDSSATNLLARTESKVVTPMHFKGTRPCFLSISAIATTTSNQAWHLRNMWLPTRQCPFQCPH